MNNIKDEVYFPLYHEDQCIERDKKREEVLDKYGAESKEYEIAFDFWIKGTKLPHKKNWKFIILNGNIAGIGDKITFNLRFGEVATGIIKSIKTFGFQGEYSLVIDTPQIVKDKYGYENDTMDIGREYYPSLIEYKICYKTYMDNIVSLEDPYRFEQIQGEAYYKDDIWQNKYK